MRPLRFLPTFRNHANRLTTKIAAATCWLLILTFGCLCASASDLDNADPVFAEYSGNHYVFEPYFKAGEKAEKKHDWVGAQHAFLRAYRNTGMTLAPTEKDLKQALLGALLGVGGNLFGRQKFNSYAEKLDKLTPLPGTGAVTNDVLDGPMSWRRSLAAYSWGRATGHLGDFAGAETAFRYSLRLETTTVYPRDRSIAPRYFELARLYTAWGKPALAVESYRAAFSALPPEHVLLKSDPIGYADTLEEFAGCLEKSGQTTEAAQHRTRATEIRAANPKKKAKFRAEPYPSKVTVRGLNS